MTMVQMNVRIDAKVKNEVEEVLKGKGVSVSDVIRSLWLYIADRKEVPVLETTAEEQAREAEKQAAREAKAIAKQEKQGKKAAKSQEKAVAAGDDATDGTTVTDGSQAVGKSQAADESNESDETNESQKPQSPHESQKQSTIDEN